MEKVKYHKVPTNDDDQTKYQVIVGDKKIGVVVGKKVETYDGRVSAKNPLKDRVSETVWNAMKYEDGELVKTGAYSYRTRKQAANELNNQSEVF